MNARQRQLYAALRAASDNVTIQLGLIYVVANRVGASQRDGPVRECRG